MVTSACVRRLRLLLASVACVRRLHGVLTSRLHEVLSYLSSSPVLGEVNRRPLKGGQAVGGVTKKNTVVPISYPLTL